MVIYLVNIVDSVRSTTLPTVPLEDGCCGGDRHDIVTALGFDSVFMALLMFTCCCMQPPPPALRVVSVDVCDDELCCSGEGWGPYFLEWDVVVSKSSGNACGEVVSRSGEDIFDEIDWRGDNRGRGNILLPGRRPPPSPNALYSSLCGWCVREEKEKNIESLVCEREKEEEKKTNIELHSFVA